MNSIFPNEYYHIMGYSDGEPCPRMSSNYSRKKKVMFYKFPGHFYDLLPEKARKIVEESPKKEYKSISVVDEDGNLEKFIPIGTHQNVQFIHPWKEDINGNIYIVVEKKNSKGKDESSIYKYDFNGNLKNIINLPVYSLSYRTNEPKPFVSWNGDVYQIIWNVEKLNKGLEVIKWEAKKQ